MTNDVMSTWAKYIIYVLPLISLAVLLFLFNSTNPSTIGPLGIFTVFVLIYLFWLGFIFTITHVLIVLLKRLKITKKLTFNPQKGYYIASVIAFVPVLVLGMQSVGQLEVWDVLLAVAFCSLATFYVIRRTT